MRCDEEGVWSLDILSPKIPPTQLVDRSYSAYGKGPRLGFPKSHQRSWWIVHTLSLLPRQKPSDEEFPSALELAIAELCGLRLSMNNPPTALVGLGEAEPAGRFCRLSMNNPPTALVGFGQAEPAGRPFLQGEYGQSTNRVGDPQPGE